MSRYFFAYSFTIALINMVRFGGVIRLFYSSLLLSHCYLMAIGSGLKNALNNVGSYSGLVAFTMRP
ncbi:hypothetical protein TUM4636_22520 [Shewanella glacialipiscicola]|uniref:Uncharacterized protein n=1 Tax=Shewanella glacialipiscicola TaxID=614069 RepID=A0ABQ6J7F5_9GAMM|nr:hypothetical protein TUM4636_22520 [Shewanella glacialipiscicola]GMA82862.1 hypothetical protein GCM10025855_23950 [Shewanella glacialipiscicola]